MQKVFKGIVAVSKFSGKLYELCEVQGKEIWLSAEGNAIDPKHLVNHFKVS